MKKLLGIMVLGLLLSGNAYAKVKLQCQGLVEIVEKNIIYLNFKLPTLNSYVCHNVLSTF